MNKKEMIEEMASDMNFACIELSKEQRLEIARALINLDYRKISEGSVVLTVMQYNALLNNQSTVISIDEQIKKEYEYELKQARKETAKEFAEYIKAQMIERFYMGIAYKQGTFSDRVIDEFVQEFLTLKNGVVE